MPESLGEYNDILYPPYLASQASPGNLAVRARLKGLAAAPPERCRMLEPGCGDGASLIAFAYAMPESEFVGVDLAERPVEIGNERIARLGLKNVTLRCDDVCSIDAGYGDFDYIFAHGLFSWAPEPVRNRVLGICAERLAPQGVAYLSYNAYPGAYFSDMLRTMLLFHTRQAVEPRRKLEQSLGLLQFIASAPEPDGPYRDFIRRSLEGSRTTPPEALLYDQLGAVNQPFYFHEFAQLAAAHGLQFLSEATFDPSAPALRASLAPIGGDILAAEQYADFLVGRRFRQTLLCRSGIELDHRSRWEPLTGFYFASPAVEVPAEAKDPPGSARFRGIRDRSAAAADPLAQAACRRLGSAWPGLLSFAELVQGDNAGDAAAPKRLGRHLLAFAEAGFLAMHAQRYAVCTQLSDRPRASALARDQAGERFQASLTLEAVGFEEPLGRMLLPLLDGTRTREELVRELDGILTRQMPPGESASARLAEMRSQLGHAVEQRLRLILNLGLLEA